MGLSVGNYVTPVKLDIYCNFSQRPRSPLLSFSQNVKVKHCILTRLTENKKEKSINANGYDSDFKIQHCPFFTQTNTKMKH